MPEKLIEIAVTVGSILLLGLLATNRIESILDVNQKATEKLINDKILLLDKKVSDTVIEIENLNSISEDLKKALDENTKVKEKEIAEIGALKNAPVSALVDKWNTWGHDERR